MMDFDSIQFEVSVTDITLLEANCKYEEVCNIMDNEPIVVKKWMLRSIVCISSRYGYAEMMCHFYYDGRIYIADYSPPNGDVFYNSDIVFLVQWIRSNGWRKPQPLPVLIESNSDFWKHQWDSFLIDSDFFDDKYGKRPEIDLGNE